MKPPKSVASYVSVRPVSSRYHYRRESYSSAQWGASDAKARARKCMGFVWAREGKLANARRGAVRAPPGGLGQFLTLGCWPVSSCKTHYQLFDACPMCLSPRYILNLSTHTAHQTHRSRPRGSRTRAAHQNGHRVADQARPRTARVALCGRGLARAVKSRLQLDKQITIEPMVIV